MMTADVGADIYYYISCLYYDYKVYRIYFQWVSFVGLLKKAPD